MNIRRSKDKWQGLRAQQTDAAFWQFETMALAMAKHENGDSADIDTFAMLKGWEIK
ncbi:hypothetical protein [Xylanibacter brevis]|uniref:hypothetical protein n=1 Tax=Xylanibacter brevis TaxID=83231 RepID=UPI000A417134|nr:hypothetical protein [Xylanibacter brevis]